MRGWDLQDERSSSEINLEVMRKWENESRTSSERINTWEFDEIRRQANESEQRSRFQNLTTTNSFRKWICCFFPFHLKLCA